MDLFTNRKPTQVQATDLDEITAGMLLLYDCLEGVLPEGRFKALAMTKLEECSMWAKKSAVFDG